MPWLLLILLFLSPNTYAESAKDDKTKTVGAVSIKGNTELPDVTFDLPWKLPTIAKRSEEAPPAELEGMLDPIEPVRHRKNVFFRDHLKLEHSRF